MLPVSIPLRCPQRDQDHPWISFFASRNFLKPRDFAGYFNVCRFCHEISFSPKIILLTCLHFSPKILLSSLEHLLHYCKGPWVSEICSGCQGFWCGCPLGLVGVLKPTVEYNSPPILHQCDGPTTIAAPVEAGRTAQPEAAGPETPG